ncbi:hypothetical protein ACWD9X_44025, partial [Streptomyces sp. NPDC005075]
MTLQFAAGLEMHYFPAARQPGRVQRRRGRPRLPCSATARAAWCCPVSSGQAAYTIRPPRRPQRGHRRAVPPAPRVKAKVDFGYQGLAKEFPRQVSA